jgi:hypothetical protein
MKVFVALLGLVAVAVAAPAMPAVEGAVEAREAQPQFKPVGPCGWGHAKDKRNPGEAEVAC